MGINVLPTPVYRPATNGQVERVHRDLRQLIPLALEQYNFPSNRWSDILPIVANWVNTNVHSTTKFPPELVQLGRSTLDAFDPSNCKYHFGNLNELWLRVKENITKAQEANRHDPPTGTVHTELKAGDKVWAFLKDAKDPVPAEVLVDKGATVTISKISGTNHRFDEIPIHKSRLSLRL